MRFGMLHVENLLELVMGNDDLFLLKRILDARHRIVLGGAG